MAAILNLSHHKFAELVVVDPSGAVCVDVSDHIVAQRLQDPSEFACVYFTALFLVEYAEDFLQFSLVFIFLDLSSYESLELLILYVTGTVLIDILLPFLEELGCDVVAHFLHGRADVSDLDLTLALLVVLTESILNSFALGVCKLDETLCIPM